MPLAIGPIPAETFARPVKSSPKAKPTGYNPLAMLLVTLGWSTAGLAQPAAPQGLTQPAGPQSLISPLGSAQTGISADSTELRRQVDGLFQAPADDRTQTEESEPDEGKPLGEEDEGEAKPAWQIAPSIGLSGAWTNAAPGRDNKAHDSWIGIFEPTLLVNANTDRIQGTVFLNPKLQYYTAPRGRTGSITTSTRIPI